MKNNKAFSFVEIIIAISIIVLLAVIGLSSKQGYDENKNNTKVLSDTKTITNALESYSEENATLPMPGGNTNFYAKDTSYMHSYTGSETFGVYGSITEDTIPKKYLDILPLDPRTNSYYSYGKTKTLNQFEIASVQMINGEYQAKVIGNYSAENGPYNLIREYNGSNFVYDKSKTNLPYNPEELILIATAGGVVYRENAMIKATSGDLEIFFSDGSVSVLEEGGELTLDKLSFPNKNNLNTFVKLSLGAGTIWTKATHLNDGSEFEVYTTDSTAAVRGTIFGVSKDSTSTEVIVIEGEVEVYTNDDYKTKIIDLVKDESVRVVNGVKDGTATTDPTTIPEFSIATDLRGDETVAMINTEETVEENQPLPEDNKCPIYNENGYTSEGNLDMGVYDFFKTVSTSDGHGTVTYKRQAECKDNLTYDQIQDSVYNTICNDGYIASNDGMNCNCTFTVNGEEMCEQELDGMPLIAYAPYNTAVTSASMIDSTFLKMHNIDDNISSYSNFKNWVFDGFPFLDIYKNVSGSNYGVKIDNINNDDFIKYSNLGLNHNEDFIIEMRVKIPNDTEKHYLLSNGNFNLFAENGILKFNTGDGSPDSTNNPSLVKGSFNTIYIKKSSSNVSFKVGTGLWKTAGTHSTNITELFVGAKYISSLGYVGQINDIIDYIKIYK